MIPKLSGVFPVFRPLMRINPDYFDKSLPKSSVQLIIIRANTSIFKDENDCKSNDAAYTAYCKFAGTIHYELLKKLLTP